MPYSVLLGAWGLGDCLTLGVTGELRMICGEHLPQSDVVIG